jgi:HPt (histidine-containing phosphotransfer) domain-containing protein
MTANIFDEDRQACYDAGMVDFLAKPFNPKDLYATLLRWLSPGDGLTTTGDRPHLSTAKVLLLPGLDVDAGLHLWHAKPAAYTKYLHKFDVDHGGTVQRIAQHLASGERSLAKDLAHKLKGASGNLALPDLAQAAGLLEQALVSGAEGQAELQALLHQLDVARSSIQTYLQSIEADVDAVESELPNVTVDPGELRMALQGLLAGLHTDNPDNAEPALQQLSAMVGTKKLQEVLHALDNFDFRGAERATYAVAQAHGIDLGS